MSNGQTALRSQIEHIIAPIIAEAEKALNPTPGRIMRLVPGEAAEWDDCCEGQLWGRLVAVQPISDQQRQANRPCPITGYVATLELGVIRCVHTVDDNGHAPAPKEIEMDGLQTVRDMETLANVLACADVRSINQWLPLGASGGCGGGMWLFTVRLDNCANC